MRPKFRLIVLFASLTFLASPIQSEMLTPFNFVAQHWTAACETNTIGNLACSPPTPSSSAYEISFLINTDLKDGEATVKKAPLQNSLEEASLGTLSLFVVRPHEALGLPKYVQIKLELSGEAAALCAQSVRLTQPTEIPPLICAGYSASANGARTQKGITLQYKRNE